MTALETLIPGAITLRPTRKQAEGEPKHFYALLDTLRSPERLPLRKIAEVIGDSSLNPEPNTLRKIKNQTIPDDGRRSLLRHIFDEGQLLSGRRRRDFAAMHDGFYFAFLHQFNIREGLQDDARAQVVGTYKFWRYSLDHEGEFVLGKLVCTEDPETHAVKVDIRMKKSRDRGVGRISRNFSGYLFSMQGTFLTVTRRDASDEVRMSLFPRYRMDTVGTDVNPRSIFAGCQNHVVLMDGVTIGIDHRNSFLTPVHLSLVDDVDELAKLDEALDVVSEDDDRIPARIVNKLKRHGPLRWL